MIYVLEEIGCNDNDTSRRIIREEGRRCPKKGGRVELLERMRMGGKASKISASGYKIFDRRSGEKVRSFEDAN